MDMARDRAKLYGFLLLSMIFSACTTVVFVHLIELDENDCAVIGTLAGEILPCPCGRSGQA